MTHCLAAASLASVLWASVSLAGVSRSEELSSFVSESSSEFVSSAAAKPVASSLGGPWAASPPVGSPCAQCLSVWVPSRIRIVALGISPVSPGTSLKAWLMAPTAGLAHEFCLKTSSSCCLTILAASVSPWTFERLFLGLLILCLLKKSRSSRKDLPRIRRAWYSVRSQRRFSRRVLALSPVTSW